MDGTSILSSPAHPLFPFIYRSLIIMCTSFTASLIRLYEASDRKNGSKLTRHQQPDHATQSSRTTTTTWRLRALHVASPYPMPARQLWKLSGRRINHSRVRSGQTNQPPHQSFPGPVRADQPTGRWRHHPIKFGY
jgi:hypothetical protein